MWSFTIGRTYLSDNSVTMIFLAWHGTRSFSRNPWTEDLRTTVSRYILIESFERRNKCDTEIDTETLNAGGTLAGIVSRTVRPSPGRSSTTLTATADEGAEVARVG